MLRHAAKLLTGHLILVCVSIAVAQTPQLQDKPSASLSAQLRLDGTLGAAQGAAPESSRAEAARFSQEGERRFARLVGPGDVAVWKAQGFISNAQGAVSFWVRCPQQEETRQVTPVLVLCDTGGGVWTLKLAEEPYKPPEAAKPRKGTPATGLPAAESLVQEGEGKEEGAGGVALEEKKTPVGHLTCQVSLTLLADGLGGDARSRVDVFQKGAWHHVVWTWRSVNHLICVDGKPCGGGTLLSRIQPPSNPEARVKLLGCGLDVSDLRIFRRCMEPEEAALLAAATPGQYLPEPAVLRLWADWGLSSGRAVVYVDTASLPGVAQVQLACVGPDGQPGRKAAMTSLPSGMGEAVVRVTEGGEPFPPGAHRFDGVALDAQGRELARGRSAEWTAEKLAEPWRGCRVALDAEKKVRIIPPYTPIEVQGNVVRTVCCRHTLDRDGLFKSVEAAGGELLAGPVALQVVSGGKALEFSGGPGLAAVENKGDEANWSAQTVSPEGHRLEVAAHMEYDGVTRFDVALVPKDALEVERIELRIPYREETLQLVHSVASGFIHRFMAVEKKDGARTAQSISWSVGMPKEPHRRDGVIFDANDLHHLPEVTPSRFVPFVHVGNCERGLSWFVDNDSGWVNDLGKVPSMELVATPQEQYLRLNVAARAVKLTQPLRFSFYLLPNPFKPLPKDWRTWSCNYAPGDKLQAHSKHIWWWHWNEYAQSFYPYPGGTFGKTYDDWKGAFKGSDIIHAPFINYGTPAGSGLFIYETQVLPYTWKVHNTRPCQDYVVYWLDKCVKDIGIKGVYVDESYCEPYSYNILAGDTPYLREDGTRGIGWRWMEGRSFFRRIKQMFVDNGFDYSLWIHTSSWKGLPMLTFADVSMDGEWPAIWVSSFTNYHDFYNYRKSRGYLCGVPFGFVGTQMLNGNVNPNTFPETYTCSRTYLAVTLPAGVVPHGTNIPAEFQRVNNIRYEFGIFDEGLEELTLDAMDKWLPGAKSRPEALNLSGLLNRTRGQALLYATAPWAKTTRFELEGGLGGLALGKPHAHAWNAENGASLAVDGRTVIDLPPGDVAVLLVRGADKPQAPRPDGAVLGVSFDGGLEPDFGGGLAPVTVAEGQNAPEFVPGRAGKAAALSSTTGPVSYPVVPSWVAGTVEFDLQVTKFDDKPLRVLSLAHQLDLSLAVVEKDGRQGLLLATNEAEAGQKVAPWEPQKRVKREVFAPVAPVAPDAWNRVALVWRSGQYDLYWNGERAGRMIEGAGPSLRDGEFPAAGVLVGNSGGGYSGGRAVLDSLIVYDWAFGAEDAAGYKRRAAPMAAAPRPAPRDTFPVWVWGKRLDSLMFGVNLSAYKDWAKVTQIKFELFDKANTKAALGVGQCAPWLGTGVAPLMPNVKDAKITDKAPALVGGEDEAKDLLDEDIGGEEKTFLLKVELLADKETVATRQVEIKTGMEGLKGEY